MKTFRDFLNSDDHEFEDDELMVERGHEPMHGLPTWKVTQFSEPANGKVYTSRDEVAQAVGLERVGEAS
jgi:hypothetical protein